MSFFPQTTEVCAQLWGNVCTISASQRRQKPQRSGNLEDFWVSLSAQWIQVHKKCGGADQSKLVNISVSAQKLKYEESPHRCGKTTMDMLPSKNERSIYKYKI